MEGIKKHNDVGRRGAIYVPLDWQHGFDGWGGLHCTRTTHRGRRLKTRNDPSLHRYAALVVTQDERDQTAAAEISEKATGN